MISKLIRWFKVVLLRQETVLNIFVNPLFDSPDIIGLIKKHKIPESAIVILENPDYLLTCGRYRITWVANEKIGSMNSVISCVNESGYSWLWIMNYVKDHIND